MAVILFIVFNSPNELRHPIWLGAFHEMVALGVLTLFYIDEARIFAEYGL